MPERGFDTNFWTDPFIVRLSMESKTLYVYLWTNSRCNQAGLYEIGVETIASETGLAVESVPNLLKMLEPKVKWYPEQDLVWVKNFLKRQAKSPKFLIAAAKCLGNIKNNGTVKELLDYNLQRHSISIPYEYSIDTVAILDSDTKVAVVDSDTSASASAKSNSGSSSDKEGGEEAPAPEKISAEVQDKELAVISQLYEANIGMLTPMIVEQLRDIRARYPPGWFGEALKEAVALEHRSLKYIEAILARWKTEGFKSRTKAKGRKEEREGKGQRVKGARPASDFSGRSW